MPDEERFFRQMRVSGIGPEGQAALSKSRVLVVGCGALGSVLASFIVRAGVGTVHLVDDDWVELSNLYRQILFDQEDALQRRDKALVVASKLSLVHPFVTVKAHRIRLLDDNIDALVGGVDVVVDGTDNFETRYRINDTCVRLGIPWVYGGVLGMTGMSMTVVPGQTPCLRCVFPSVAGAQDGPTPEREGVFGPVVGVVASLQAAEALKLLMGHPPSAGLARVDLMEGSLSRLDLGGRRPDCSCGQSC